MIRVADYVMQKLVEIGIHKLFLVTGRGVLYLSDALAKCDGIDGVSVHHEQAGAYAAMAYSQASDNIGACLVSTGCASTNAITPVLCAWQDDIPMIIISGQNKLNETTTYTGLPIRTYGQQEANIIELVRPITKYATMIVNPEDIVFELEKAIYLANAGRKGPVWIDIPLDIQNARIEVEELRHFEPTVTNETVSLEDLQFVIEKISKAKRPILLYGSGIRSAKAVTELQQAIKKFQIPAVYSSSAVDILDSKDDLIIGCTGAMATNRAANFAIQNADLILVLGCRMNSMITGSNIDTFAREAEIITVDIDKYEHQKFENKITKQIVADAKDFLNKFLNTESLNIAQVWKEKCKHWKTIFPKCESSFKNDTKIDLYQLAETLEGCLREDAICITDAGLEEIIVPTTINFSEKQRCLHPVSQGAMGYALPAAIGAYLANNKQIVAIIGDGSIMMNLQELQTITYNKLPIKILVINNNCYAVIRKRQQDLFRTRTIGTDFENGISCPDFKKVADCFGFRYEKIASTSELKRLNNIINADEPLICEIFTKEDQTYIHSSYRRGKSGKFIQPPIEDQSPFLNRDLFEKEMIINPMEE